MKRNLLNIGLISDCHLEDYNLFTNGSGKSQEHFNEHIKINPPSKKLDVLIVAGDFCEFKLQDIWAYAINKLENYADMILFVPGNHEYWRGHFQKFQEYKNFIESLSNKVRVLNNEEFIFNDVSFYLSTLWTDYDKDPYIMQEAQDKYPSLIKDKNIFKIKLNFNKMRPMHFASEAMKSKRNIKNWLEKSKEGFEGKRVLVTHYPPFEDQVDCSYLFNHEKDEKKKAEKSKLSGKMEFTDLTDILLENQDVVVAHGHLHNASNYQSKKTNNTVYCNPKGFFNFDSHDSYDIFEFSI